VISIQPELWVDRPGATVSFYEVAFGAAVAAGTTRLSPVSDEHGWRSGGILDPFGREWEIGAPLGAWPASSA
jgi:hypothetical protein